MEWINATSLRRKLGQMGHPALVADGEKLQDSLLFGRDDKE